MSITERPDGRADVVTRRWRRTVVICLGVLILVAMPGLVQAAVAPNMYTVHPLVSDQAGMAPVLDPNLINGWGIAAGPATPWWVSDNGTDKSTLYDGAGTPRSLVVDVASAPTGVVFNGTTQFKVSSGEALQPARFLFATEEGTVLGWNPNVPAAGSTTAFVVKDRSGVGAVYKGLAIGSVGDAPYLYATDFVNGRIDEALLSGSVGRLSLARAGRHKRSRGPSDVSGVSGPSPGHRAALLPCPLRRQ